MQSYLVSEDTLGWSDASLGLTNGVLPVKYIPIGLLSMVPAAFQTTVTKGCSAPNTGAYQAANLSFLLVKT